MLKINELKKVFKNKKVLITGHTGFKGTYMCIMLKYLGAKIYGYSLNVEKNSLYNYIVNKHGNKLVDNQVFSDIRDLKKIKSYIKKVNPDFIIHMAAQALVINGYKYPHYTYETNVMGTVNLFEAIREIYLENKKSLLSILNITTDKVYENKNLLNYAYKETDKLCGYDPYANSKSCSEIITYGFSKSFFYDKKKFRISTARAGNVIGGGDLSDNRIIPDCFSAIKNKKNIILRNPNSIRPYQFVLEPLIIYLNIHAMQIKNEKYENSYNIGPDINNSITTNSLVNMFFDEWLKQNKTNYKKYIKINHKNNSFYEHQYLMLDNNLIKKNFHYKEIFNIDKTIELTVKIYSDILKNVDVVNTIYNIIENNID